MPVATRDAFRSITTQGTAVGESDGVALARAVDANFTLAAGFGITLVTDVANNKVTITNSGNGTGALTTITTQNASGTYYPIFTRAANAGDFNATTGTYQMSTMYYETTTNPLTYNPGSGTLSCVSLALSGQFSIQGVTATGTSGTGNLVFSSSPTITSPQILTSALVGPTTSANLTRFPNALSVFSNTAAGIQQNESHNIGVMGEGTGSAVTTTITGTSGQNTITVGSATGLYVGQFVTGAGIGANAVITIIAGTTITLSVVNSGAVSGTGTFVSAGVGLYGAGYTSGAARSGGVVGEGHVSATADTAAAIGVRGYANDTHAGGFNIGLYGDATNGASSYALFMNRGDIYAGGVQTWYLNGNLTFNGAYTVGVGTFTATTVNKVTITAPATASTLTVADGKTFTVNNTITLAGTDGITTTLPSTAGTLALNNQTFSLGTTSIAINRASAAISLTGITSIDGYSNGLAGGNNTTLLGALPFQSNLNVTSLLSPNTSTTKKFLNQTGDGTNGASPVWGTLAAGDIPAFNLGTTSITFNRASGAQSLTGISIDGSAGKATNLVGGNANTLLGSIGYQSAVDTTTLLSPNTTTTKKFLRQTGDGTNGAAPAWDTLAAGDLPTASTTAYGAVKYDGTTLTLNGSNQLVAGSVTIGTTAVAPGSSSTSFAGLTALDGAATFAIGASSTNFTESYTGTATSTHNIATGVVGSGNTKNINIGTLGGASSTTSIVIGSAVANQTSTTQVNGSLRVAQSSARIGYQTGTGAGGAITQGTSRTTGVTLNTPTGQITLFTAAPAASTYYTFTVTNSTVTTTDVVQISFQSGTNTYIGSVSAVGSGSFNITFTSAAGVASDTPVINFAVIKGAAT